MLHHRRFGTLLNVLVIMGLIFGFSCCAKKPTMTMEQQAVQSAEEQKLSSEAQAQAETKQKGSVKRTKKKDISSCVQYVVKKGDSLWWIAKYKDVYNDPFLWPIIYENNKDKIKNPNRIYPGQKLLIPKKGYKLDEIKMIRKKAGAAKPYTPPKRAKLPVD